MPYPSDTENLKSDILILYQNFLMIPNYSLFLELLGFTFPSFRIPYKEHSIA
jgi:hypothetical protein